MTPTLRRFWNYWLLAAAVMALFVRLGVWQLHRKAEKEALFAQVQAQIDARKAQPLAVAFAPDRMQAFDWAVGSCLLDGRHVVMLDNQLNDGQPGIRAFAPCAVDASGRSVMVDFGWYPLGPNRIMPKPLLPAQLDVQGLLMPPPSGGLVADQVQKGNGVTVVTRIDARSLKQALGDTPVAPRVMRLDPALKVGGKRDFHVFPTTMPPEKHFAYAVQWFAMAAAIFVITLLLSLRARKK